MKYLVTKMNSIFHLTAKKSAEIVGSAWIFFVAVTLVIVWLIMGPLFHFSNTWQLVINTATAIITFLIVFLIQHTHNRDLANAQLKKEVIMLDWVITFLILAVIAGLLGFSGVAIMSVEIARIVFLIFIFFFVVSLILERLSRNRLP